jgi:hypothetical protein
MYQFTQVPEADALILDQMDDDTLVQFCQVNNESQDLCLIPKIKKRLNQYQLYKTFQLETIFNQIENYASYPILIHRYELYEDINEFVLEDDIHILYQNKYVNMNCYANKLDDTAHLSLKINKHNYPKTLNDIIMSYDDNQNAVWSLDVMSILQIYQSIGLDKYAKQEAIRELNKNNLKNKYQNHTLFDFLMLYINHLWFETQIILYKLKDIQLNEFDIIINQDDFNVDDYELQKNLWNNDITTYYNLILNDVYNAI